MKKVLTGLLVLTAIGLMLVACMNPINNLGGGVKTTGSGNNGGPVVLNETDKIAVAIIVPTVSGRTNASGKDISSNAQGAAVPGMYFFWDPKQKDNGYLKVEATMFLKYDSFVLTTKEANKYWDFLIKLQDNQAKTDDGYYVFYIPKQEKNINGVWISDYVAGGLPAYIEELYASEDGLIGRTRKMQAFIMEIALHAKLVNPNFKIIPQDGIDLAFEDGDWNKGAKKALINLVDGWGIEGAVGTADSDLLPSPSTDAQKYTRLTEYGLMVTDTTTCTTPQRLQNYYNRARAWNIIPFPRIGFTATPPAGQVSLADTLYPGRRWATNTDYFYIEDPEIIGIADRINSNDINKLTDAKNYLYHINGRPYDAWDTWDAEEEAAFANGDMDRTEIGRGYAAGLLVPSPGGPYQPGGSNAARRTIAQNAMAEYGTEWDWWWRAAGYNANQGRQVWLDTLRASNYDVIYIDTFYNHRARPAFQTPLTRAEVDSLKYKANGGRRQIIGYLSIGSAEQNRWYCQQDWIEPADADDVNSDWVMRNGYVSGGVYYPPVDIPMWLADSYGGSYDEEAIVAWWHPEWRDIIVRGNSVYKQDGTGDNTSSIDRILAQGFDGTYLDNVGVYDRSNWNRFETYWAANGGFPFN